MSHHDFDFEFGRWVVRHRRLRDRLVGCTDWDEFTGSSETRSILGGAGCIEENLIDLPTGQTHAIALRSYDAASDSWAIWWLSAADPHRLDVPVIGRFENGVGTFTALDSLAGRPVLVRFLWLQTSSSSPRWEQAMSGDDGESWETNWTMDFARAQAR